MFVRLLLIPSASFYQSSEDRRSGKIVLKLKTGWDVEGGSNSRLSSQSCKNGKYM